MKLNHHVRSRRSDEGHELKDMEYGVGGNRDH